MSGSDATAPRAGSPQSEPPEDKAPQSETHLEPDQQPLNRAERRAQGRGKQPRATGSNQAPSQPAPKPVVPRRAGRRGNR